MYRSQIRYDNIKHDNIKQSTFSGLSIFQEKSSTHSSLNGKYAHLSINRTFMVLLKCLLSSKSELLNKYLIKLMSVAWQHLAIIKTIIKTEVEILKFAAAVLRLNKHDVSIHVF